MVYRPNNNLPADYNLTILVDILNRLDSLLANSLPANSLLASGLPVNGLPAN
jgi:hypothetical protein